MLRTSFAHRGFDPDPAVAKLGKAVPISRIAGPADIADVILFPGSDRYRDLCGAVVEPNGAKAVGWTCW